MVGVLWWCLLYSKGCLSWDTCSWAHVWLRKGESQKVLGTQFFGMVNMLFPIPSWCPARTVYTAVSCLQGVFLLVTSSLREGPSRESGAWLHSRVISISGSRHSLVKPKRGQADRSIPTSSLPRCLCPFIPAQADISEDSWTVHWISMYLSRKTSFLTWASNLGLFPHFFWERLPPEERKGNHNPSHHADISRLKILLEFCFLNLYMHSLEGIIH